MTIYVGYNGSAVGVDPTEWHDEIFSAKREWNYNIAEHGYAITRTGDHPWNHQMIGTGVGHRDAEFCESRNEPGEPWSSMAAYYENAAGGWWSQGGLHHCEGVKYYGMTPRDDCYVNESFARHDYLNYVGASHDDCPYEYCDKRLQLPADDLRH